MAVLNSNSLVSDICCDMVFALSVKTLTGTAVAREIGRRWTADRKAWLWWYHMNCSISCGPEPVDRKEWEGAGTGKARHECHSVY